MKLTPREAQLTTLAKHLCRALKAMVRKFERSGAAYLTDADWQRSKAAIAEAERVL